MKISRKDRRKLRKENKTKVFLGGLDSLVRAAKRAELGLDDLSKFLRTDIAEHWAGQQMARVIEEARLAAKNQEEADFMRAMAAGKISPAAFLIGTFLGGNEK